MAAPYTTSSTVAAPVNRQVMKEFLRRQTRVCVYPAYTKTAELAKHGGSFTAFWRRYDSLSPSTTSLSELTGNQSVPARTSITPSVTNVTKAVSKYGQFIMPNEEVDLLNPTQQDAEFMALMVECGGRSLNQLARNEMEDNATQVRVGGVAADNLIVSPLTVTAVRGVTTTLNVNGARKLYTGTAGSQNVGTTPIREALRGIASVYLEHDIRSFSGFVSAEQYGNQTELMPNEIGMGAGVRWQVTEDATVDATNGGANALNPNLVNSSSKITLFDSIIHGVDAVGGLGLGVKLPDEEWDAEEDGPPAVEIIVKGMTEGGALNPFNEFGSVAYKVWAAYKILNTAWIRRITSGATLHQ